MGFSSPPASSTYAIAGGGSAPTSWASYTQTGGVTTGDWYVDPTAVTNGVGTFTDPFDNLHSALTAASANQTILIRAGTLTPATRYLTSIVGLKVYGYGSERPVIDASALSLVDWQNQSHVPINISGADQHWKGLDVVGVKDDPNEVGWYDTGGVRVNGTTGVKLEDIHYYNGSSGGFYLYQSNDCIIQDCIYYGISSAGAGTNAADGFVTTGGGLRNIVVRCFAANAGDDGYDCFTGDSHIFLDNVAYRSGYLPGTFTRTGGDGGGFKMGGGGAGTGDNTARGNLSVYSYYPGFNSNSAPLPVTFLENTVTQASAAWAGINTGTTVGTVVNDNLSVFNDGSDWDASGVKGTYNSWNTSGEVGGDVNFPISDPLFADTFGHDYSLGVGSPALGAGITNGNLGASRAALELGYRWITYLENGGAKPSLLAPEA